MVGFVNVVIRVLNSRYSNVSVDVFDPSYFILLIQDRFGPSNVELNNTIHMPCWLTADILSVTSSDSFGNLRVVRINIGDPNCFELMFEALERYAPFRSNVVLQAPEVSI